MRRNTQPKCINDKRTGGVAILGRKTAIKSKTFKDGARLFKCAVWCMRISSRASPRMRQLGAKLTGFHCADPLTCNLNVNIAAWLRLWAVVSGAALFPRLDSSLLALALHFPSRAARWTFPSSCLLQHSSAASQGGGLSPLCPRVIVACLAPALRVIRICASACVCVVYVSTEVQLPAPASLAAMTSVSRGRFLLSESPACDVSGLDAQCPPFTVK